MPPQASRRPRLLVIEDNPHDLHLITSAIDELRPDAEVFTTEHGPDGADIARRELPDLILLDLFLPTEPGLETLIRLKRDGLTKRIPIVVLSGHPVDDLVWSSYHAYAAAFLVKPASYDAFVQMLRVTVDFWFMTARLTGPSRGLANAPHHE